MRRTLDEENPTHPSADHPHAAPGRTGHREHGPSRVAKELGISEATFYRWKTRYGGMNPQETKRLRELEKENARLKRLLAEKELDIDMLKEINQGNF